MSMKTITPTKSEARLPSVIAATEAVAKAAIATAAVAKAAVIKARV